MTKVRIVPAGTVPLRIPKTVPPEGDGDFVAVADDYDGPNALRFLHPGSDDDLQLFQVRMAPNAAIPSHAHAADEIIYVLAGALQLGNRTLGPGSSVYIPGETLYGFAAGPDGLEFLNFRAAKDLTYFEAAEVVERRRQAKVATAH